MNKDAFISKSVGSIEDTTRSLGDLISTSDLAPLLYDIRLLAALLIFFPVVTPASFRQMVDIAFIALGFARVASPNMTLFVAIRMFDMLASSALVERGSS
ncbi:hypothetical protein [Ensifer aridi]|uniref:hypothetical protein n=1 Tax=Ensifer aridi TaxID=1708715 RepID=UPI00111C2FF9|nr:hypothetical protein [Ensifer aridi]